MACPICNSPSYLQCNCEAEPYCEPCTSDSKCIQKIDAECVIYHRDDDKPSKLTCMGMPNKSTAEEIFEKIDSFICKIADNNTPITEIDSPSINLTAFGPLKHTIQADVNISEDAGNSIEIREDGIYSSGGSGGSYTSNNGITLDSPSTFQLGGNLIQDTEIDLNSASLSLLDSTTATGVAITPDTGIVDLHGKVVADYTCWVKNNASFGPVDGTMTFGSITASPRLIAQKTGSLAANWSVESCGYFNLFMGVPGAENSTETYSSLFSNMDWRITSNQSIRQQTVISSSVANFQYNSDFRTSGGNLSAHCARITLSSDGTVDRLIGYRVKSPQPDASGYDGLVDEMIGIQIEGLKSSLPTQITDSYAIKQLGASDSNLFTGPLKLPSGNLSIGKATLVGGTVTVTTTAAKTGSHIFITRNTPGGTTGQLSVPDSAIVNGVSFTINSTSGSETSTVNWWIINN